MGRERLGTSHLLFPARDTKPTEPPNGQSSACGSNAITAPLPSTHKDRPLQKQAVHGRTGGKQELSAKVRFQLTSPKSCIAVAPGPSGHTTPNLTSALSSKASMQRAADNSSHHISAIPQQGLSSSNNQKTAEAQAPSPFRWLRNRNKAGVCSQVHSSDGQDIKGPLHTA